MTTPEPHAAAAIAALLPDLANSRMLILGAGGVGLATARLARALGMSVAVANRSPGKLDALRADVPELPTFVVNVRDPDSVNPVLDATGPDHIVLATGRVMGLAAGSIALAQAMDYVGDRLEPILAIANWIARSAKKPRSFTIVAGFIGVPTMGNLAWSIAGPAIRGAVEHLAVELGPTRVNVLGPGPIVDTAMARAVVRTDEGVKAMTQALAAQLPIGRAVVVEDVARQIMALAGDPIVTGSMRFAEGGLSLAPGAVLKNLHIKDHGH